MGSVVPDTTEGSLSSSLARELPVASAAQRPVVRLSERPVGLRPSCSECNERPIGLRPSYSSLGQYDLLKNRLQTLGKLCY